MRKVRNIHQRVVSTVPPVPDNGATAIALSAVTWTKWPNRTQSNIDTAAAPPDTEYGSATGVRMWVDPADLTGWDIGCRGTFTAPFNIENPSFSLRVRLKEYPSSVNKFARLSIRVRYSIDAPGTFTNYYECNHWVQAGRYTKLNFGGPEDLLLPVTERTGIKIVGTIPAGATIKHMEILTGADGGVAPELFLQALWHSGCDPNIVIWSGDDGFSTQYYGVHQAFQEFQVPYTMNVISGAAVGIGSSGKMTLAQLKELHATGLVSYSVHMDTHPNLAQVVAMSDPALLSEVVTCRDLIVAEGLSDQHNSHLHIALPFGNDGRSEVRTRILAACAAAGMISVRGTSSSCPGYGRSSRVHGSCTFLDVTNPNVTEALMARRLRQLAQGSGNVMRIGFHMAGTVSGTTFSPAAGATSNDYPYPSLRNLVKLSSELRATRGLLIMTEAEYQSWLSLKGS